MKDSNSEIYRFIRDIRENRTSAAAEAAGAQNNPFAEKNSASLLKALQKMSSEEIRSSEFYNYLSYRSSHYLISSDWNVRNNAVKMCGLLKDPEKIPLMSRILRNEKKGFIRRNIISSYIKTGVYSETVESDIYNGLSDTYWEVAAESLKAVWIFHEDTVSNDKIESRVKELLNSGNFEILLNAVGAYQVYISGPDGIAQLRKFYFHDNWKIREAVMTALNELKKRKIIDPVELKKEIDSMLLVSSGFTPVFMMKKKVRDIQL